MSGRVLGLAAAGGMILLAAVAVALAQTGAAASEGMSGGGMGFVADIAERFGPGVREIVHVILAIPRVPGDLARVLWAISLTTPAGMSPWLPVAVAAGIALLVLAIPPLLRAFGRRRLARRLASGGRFMRALKLLAFDAAAFVVAVAVSALLIFVLFERELLIGKLAITLVGATVRWRLTMLMVEVLLRPRQPDLRLIPVDDADARTMTHVAGVVLALGTLFATTLPVLLAGGLGMRQAQALSVIVGSIMAVAGIYGVRRVFADVAGWRRIGAGLSYLTVVLLWLAWTAGVVMLDFTIYHGLVWSLGIVAGTAALVRLLALAAEPPPAEPAASGPATDTLPAHATRRLVIATVRRIVIAVAGAIIAFLIARLWLVDILHIFDYAYWARVREATLTAIAVLVIGYASYELLRAWSHAKFGHPRDMSQPGLSDDEHQAPASRLSSVMPVLQGVFGVLIIGMAVLLALSHLGINVAPLIAGAGIFGLALSFGSQALVRDIVSGVFYMADDAFRVGEYIEAGKYKGSVEKILVRSVRLRHQNGQIHTVPYGQLGAVTNYSRDWTTLKFNLRLARDTDVEKVRKLTKKIGQEMLDDPEIGKEFIQPFKMQGVADIQENALVCRFKFTVRPGKPTLVQREALKRIYRSFTESGISFASTAVVVQSPKGAPVEMSAAAAMAGMQMPPVQAGGGG